MPTTIEIAKLIEKEHYIVKKDAKSMLEKLGLREEEITYKHDNGILYPCYRLSEREALILMTSYDTLLRAKIVDKLITFTGPENLL